MEPWRYVWRQGFAPLLSVRQLEALQVALERDDPRLVQRATTVPCPIALNAKELVEAACAIGYCGWHEDDQPATVGTVEERFAELCFRADQKLGAPAACRHFLNAFDDMPRPIIFRELLAEVRLALRERETNATAVPAGDLATPEGAD